MSWLLKRHKGKVVGMVLWATIASAANIYAGYLLSAYYDILTAPDIKKAVFTSLWLIFAWVFSVVLYYFSSCYQAKLIKIFNTDLRTQMLNQISNLQYGEYEKREPGEYASWMVNDITQIENNSIKPFFYAVEALTTTFFSVVALFFIHPIVLVLCIISSLILSVVPKMFEKSLTQISTKLSAINELFSQRVFNTIQGFEVFLVSNKRKEMKKRLKGMCENLEEEKFQLKRKNAQMTMYSHSLFRICEIGICCLTAVMAFLKIVSIGAVFSIANISNRFLNGVNSFWENFVLARSSENILSKFQNAPSAEKKPSCPAIQQKIELKDFSVRYGDKVVLQNVNLEFDIGKKYALVGESGSGKTSIVRAIIGLSDHYTGHILLDGVEKRSYDTDSVFSQISYISQNVYLFNDTLRYNLTLGQPFSDEEIHRALSYVNLTGFMETLPDGLDTIIGDGGKNISGGQRQRIVIARSLLQKKKIFIMDEGTSALDQKNAHIIENMILENPHLTLILITHHLQEEDCSKFERIYRLPL